MISFLILCIIGVYLIASMEQKNSVKAVLAIALLVGVGTVYYEIYEGKKLRIREKSSGLVEKANVYIFGEENKNEIDIKTPKCNCEVNSSWLARNVDLVIIVFGLSMFSLYIYKKRKAIYSKYNSVRGVVNSINFSSPSSILGLFNKAYSSSSHGELVAMALIGVYIPYLAYSAVKKLLFDSLKI